MGQPVFAPRLVLRKVVRDIDSAPRAGCTSAIETLCYSLGECPWIPDLEVFEENGRVAIHLDVPGIKPEDVTVTVSGYRVEIAGERRRASHLRRKDLHAPERTYGRFHRTVRLPERVHMAAMTWTLDNGVLQITLPANTDARTAQAA
jgi:HSP20 family protein